MKNENEYYEARQHLNLSQHAYDVIESDQFDAHSSKVLRVLLTFWSKSAYTFLSSLWSDDQISQSPAGK